MWKDSIRNIVVIFQTTILRIVGFYVRRSAIVVCHTALFQDGILFFGSTLIYTLFQFVAFFLNSKNLLC